MFPDTWPKFKTGSKQKQTKSKFRGLEMCAIQLLLSPLVQFLHFSYHWVNKKQQKVQFDFDRICVLVFLSAELELLLAEKRNLGRNSKFLFFISINQYYIRLRDHPFKTSACLRGGGGSPCANGQKVTVHKGQKSPS